jgi:hypothetical protein
VPSARSTERSDREQTEHVQDQMQRVGMEQIARDDAPPIAVAHEHASE